MKKVILLFSFLKIRKQEFPAIIDGVIAIVQKYNPKALFIDGMFNLLVELQTSLPVLTQKALSHPLSKVLKNQRKRRMELIRAILLQGAAVEKAAVPSQADAVSLILPLISRHLSNLFRENLKVVHQEVENFLAEFKQNDGLLTAAATIGVKLFIDELKALEDSMAVNVIARRESKSPGRSVNKVQLRLNIIDGFSRLLNSIELARVEHPELDYMPLINELNEFFVPYQALVRSRTTRNKTAAQKTTTAASSTTTTATAENKGL